MRLVEQYERHENQRDHDENAANYGGNQPTAPRADEHVGHGRILAGSCEIRGVFGRGRGTLSDGPERSSLGETITEYGNETAARAGKTRAPSDEGRAPRAA